MTPSISSLEGASLVEAQAAFLAAVQPLEHTTLGLAAADGAALATTICAPFSLPPFANSAMDGFAVRAIDVAGAATDCVVRLTLAGEAAAGHRFQAALAAGQTARVMTGAPLPAGADAVLPQEEAYLDGGVLLVTSPVLPGRHVRPAGEDVQAGDEVLRAGTSLGAPQVALLAALGYATVPTIRRPRVAVLTTGDELRLPGEARGDAGIYNANLFALCSQIREAGGNAVPLPAAADSPGAIYRALEAASGADAVVTSAGMCAGQHDHVAAVLRAQGHFVTGCLRLRPARHVGLGHIAGTPVFALPGNPAASLIAFELLVRPAIRRLGGHGCLGRRAIPATLGETIQGAPGATQALWADLEYRSDGGYRVWPAGRQGAGLLGTAARAKGLLIIPEGAERHAAGSTIVAYLLSGDQR